MTKPEYQTYEYLLTLFDKDDISKLCFYLTSRNEYNRFLDEYVDESLGKDAIYISFGGKRERVCIPLVDDDEVRQRAVEYFKKFKKEYDRNALCNITGTAKDWEIEVDDEDIEIDFDLPPNGGLTSSVLDILLLTVGFVRNQSEIFVR